MACKSQRLRSCQCNKNPVNSILFRMLNSEITQNRQHDNHRHACTTSRGCPCEGHRKVSLKTPEIICKKASEVLLKTVAFIKNLPSFYHLPQEDQILLVHRCWAPLFVLGLAQERVDFEFQELSEPSLLKKILLNQSCDTAEVALMFHAGVPLSEVQRIQTFLCKLWSLDICTKEYAYLKGMVLFNPGISGMRFPQYVQTLQLEAYHTLMEYTSMMHSVKHSRFAWILETLDILKLIDPKVITDLFFKPISGDINLEEILLETLLIK
ncbi:nuclear receptor subfamily 0 group B member 2-like [Spea bombifrons]|uniref:nuclear receptor subfamily 0 group B member 2-like n=1 Tax=Spea bombifrons TaxID=233779 RepID=UPI00234BE1A7|nr:nuclear receptor subfamily 0 group B member 2-like [Spea bombifrons]